MKKTTLKITEIKNNPNNPRLIKDDKFKKLVTSIQEFPEMLEAREIVVNKDHIILGGNMRYKAAKEAGLKEVPVKIVDWSEDKQRQFVIKDNVSGGEWDWDLIANEWDAEELDAWGLDTPDGWGEDTEVEEDEAPEVSDEPPVSKLGEVYQLGRHRVMCGDCTVKENVDLLMNGKKADMVFTDPPYGANMGIEGDDGEKYIDIFDKFYSVMPCDDNIYVCCDWRCIGDFYASIRKRHQVYNLIVWVKNLFGQGKLYHTKHEEIIFCGSGDYNKKNINKDENVWNADSVRNFGGSKNAAEAVGHPTQKPIEICSRAIKNSSEMGESVYDGFLGSGSTLIACEQTDRTCFGMELDEKYVDVVRKRYHKFVTGSEEGWQEATPRIGV